MVNSFVERAPRRDERPRPAHLIAVNNLLPNTHCRQNVASGAASRRNAGRFVTQFSLAQTVLTISTESRNYGDVLIWTSHGDTETQRRSTRSACTAGRAVRRANRKRTTEPRSSGRSFAVGTPRPPLRGAASSALPAARSSLCLCVSVAGYVVVLLKMDTRLATAQSRRVAEAQRQLEMLFFDLTPCPLLSIVAM